MCVEVFSFRDFRPDRPSFLFPFFFLWQQDIVNENFCRCYTSHQQQKNRIQREKQNTHSQTEIDIPRDIKFAFIGAFKFRGRKILQTWCLDMRTGIFLPLLCVWCVLSEKSETPTGSYHTGVFRSLTLTSQIHTHRKTFVLHTKSWSLFAFYGCRNTQKLPWTNCSGGTATTRSTVEIPKAWICIIFPQVKWLRWEDRLRRPTRPMQREREIPGVQEERMFLLAGVQPYRVPFKLIN